MHQDLAVSGIRAAPWCVADRVVGGLIDAETAVRYRWASQLASRRAVLDVGCGDGAGTRLLAASGAQEVVGIDRASAVIESASGIDGDAVSLVVGDAHRLPLDDDRFDLVVCFDMLDETEDPGRVLDELRRVLRPDGLLVVSSGDRRTGFALEAELSARLGHVTTLRQSDHLASAVFEEGGAAELCVPRPVGEPESARTVAVASDTPIDMPAPLALLAPVAPFRRWQEADTALTHELAQRDARIAELEVRLAERDHLAALLTDAEQRLAEGPAREARIEALEQQATQLRRDLDAAKQEARTYDERLMRSERVLVDVFNSPSWQLTKPLRKAKNLLR